MTKQQPIQADSASAVILQIPLEMLYISDLNPRKAVSEAHIESLADSIERFGLIHNLAGLMGEDGKIGIVAGGCRLRAIQIIAERSKTHPFTTVPWLLVWTHLCRACVSPGNWTGSGICVAIPVWWCPIEPLECQWSESQRRGAPD